MPSPASPPRASPRCSTAASSTKTRRSRSSDARADAEPAADPAAAGRRPPPDERSVADLVFDVSERASTLVREEIELAKAEVSEKVSKLLRGSVVGIAAGTFAFLALILVMEGIAWLLNEEVFDGKIWPGFFVEPRRLPADRRPRRLDRLQSAEGRLAAGARAGDRRGEADQGDARKGDLVSTGAPGRSPAEIRRDIDLRRQQLGTSVEALRGRVTELTDWRRQVEEHKQQLIIGAAAVGFVIGVRAMLRRRTRPRLTSTKRPGRSDAADAEQAGADVGAEDGADLGDEDRARSRRSRGSLRPAPSAVSSSWMYWTTQPSAPDSWRWRA